MPCVKGSFSGKRILLEVGFINPLIVLDEEKSPPKDFFPTYALLDTGATTSCITKKVADGTGIVSDGDAKVEGVHGAGKTITYTVGLVLPQLHFMLRAVPVVEVAFADDDPCQAVLGMDILGQGSFQMDFSGSFLFCV